MKIDGKKIASKIEKSLHFNTVPSLAVILVGKDANSLNYISQKLKIGKRIGIKVALFKYSLKISIKTLKSLVASLNQNKKIHGIIIQRPVPLMIPAESLNIMVAPGKDVDGFHPDSKFDPPVALAVMEILKSVHKKNFLNWLAKQQILIIGRGESAGSPIANYLSKNKIKFTIAHSNTKNISALIRSAKIIFSCVGKPNIVRLKNINSGTILIGVGIHKTDGMLEADYNQKEVSKKALFYTPVPGGVGPVNVAMLMKNVVKAAIINSD